MLRVVLQGRDARATLQVTHQLNRRQLGCSPTREGRVVTEPLAVASGLLALRGPLTYWDTHSLPRAVLYLPWAAGGALARPSGRAQDQTLEACSKKIRLNMR